MLQPLIAWDKMRDSTISKASREERRERGVGEDSHEVVDASTNRHDSEFEHNLPRYSIQLSLSYLPRPRTRSSLLNVVESDESSLN